MSNDNKPNIGGWFEDRMTTDMWDFGLLMTDGTIICITHIVGFFGVGNDVWIDVELMYQRPYIAEEDHREYFIAPTSRPMASINTRHIMAAFELADT